MEVVVEKMDCAGDKMKTIAVLRPHPRGALPICASQRAHTQSAMRVPHLTSPQCQIDSECPYYFKLKFLALRAYNYVSHNHFTLIVACVFVITL